MANLGEYCMADLTLGPAGGSCTPKAAQLRLSPTRREPRGGGPSWVCRPQPSSRRASCTGHPLHEVGRTHRTMRNNPPVVF